MSAPVIGHVSPALQFAHGARLASGPFTSSNKHLWPMRLGANIAIGAALCEAHRIGNEDGEDWSPGCGHEAPP